MLPSQCFLSQIKNAGRKAGYEGDLMTDCPYMKPDIRSAWIAGWYKGHRDRRESLQEGTHPSLYRKTQQVP